MWNETTQRFEHAVSLNMDPANLANYEAWFQYHDPITFALQSRRHATRVNEVMPQAELERTPFFNDFLARDGLHWGINLHAFDAAVRQARHPAPQRARAARSLAGRRVA